MGAINSNTIKLYNNNPKTLILTLTLNPNPNPRLHQVKCENYGINVAPDKK